MEENSRRLIFVLLLCFLSARVVKAGYYKIRAPPPPPSPPASIHYGPHPPAHHSHPYRIHPPHPPKHLPPAHLQPYHHPHGRIHHKSFAHREFQQRLPPPPPIYPQSLSAKTLHKIPPVYQWKNFNTFRAPIVKETFNPPPTPYIPSYIKDDDKGPIHTIPAPNLSPADKPSVFLKQNEFYMHQGHKKQRPEDDLVAVLKHGIEKVNIPHHPGYQVTEDPSLHHPNSDKPSYFAPDPDPSVPTLKVPATTDPHSVPSNGQVPLDVYLQQEADKIEAQHHETENNALTAQDLFNLMNYQQGSINILPSTHLPIYNPEQFTPQFQTFNYEEQTQQGAYGSNSFPTSSMGLQLNTDLAGFEDFKDNDVEGSEKEEVYHKINENEIVQEKKKDKKETFSKNSSTKVSPSPYYKPTTEEPTTTTTAKDVKPEENVQLQKSIQIYENYTKEEKKDGKTGRGLVVAEITPETINSQADIGGSQIPFGTRLRPKRF